MLWTYFRVAFLFCSSVSHVQEGVSGTPLVLSTQDVRTISKEDRFAESERPEQLWRIKRKTSNGDAETARRPASYVSELSGLTCSASGYFPHPTNNTKFFRCVALQSQSNYMVYLFTCDGGLVYEPTVKACVKALGEESMEAAASLDATVIWPWHVPATNLNISQEGTSSTLLSDSLRRWQVSRCREGFKTKTTTTLLFRSPINCRRFIRCSTIATTLKIEQFSCPTGLFFDEEQKVCTWATSQTSVCNMTIFDTLNPALSYRNSVNSGVTSAPSVISPGALATIWMTPSPPQLSFTPSPTVLEDVVRVFTLPYSREREGISPTVQTSSTTTTESSGFSFTVGVTLPPDSADNSIEQNSQSMYDFQPVIKPTSYLTATGVLVTDGEEFKCALAGVFPTANPCVFFKCEKYVWMDSFLLFRFQCPPHTAFSNGTCQYDSDIKCGTDGTVFESQSGTLISSSNLKNPSISVSSHNEIISTTPSPVDDSSDTEPFTPFLILPTQSPDASPLWTLPESFDEALNSGSLTGTTTAVASKVSTPSTRTQFSDSTTAAANMNLDENTNLNLIEIKSIPLSTPRPAPTSLKPGQVNVEIQRHPQKSQPVCFSSGYFLYPADATCQRFYRCLQLTPEPNSFVMLHYRCDGPFVFDTISHACMVPASASNPCQLGLGLDILPELVQPSAGSTTTTRPIMTSSTMSSQAPVVVLPKVWQMGNDGMQDGAAPLVCTTQQVYRLQTCGYYYSCLEVEKGRFRLQEIFCETLYLNVTNGQCVTPPANDPCLPDKGKPSRTTATTTTSVSTSTNTITSTTAQGSTSTSPSSSTLSSTKPGSTKRPDGFTMSLPLVSTVLNPWRYKDPRPTASSWIGNKAVAIKVPGSGSLDFSSSKYNGPNDRTSGQLSLTSYRNTFNKLYAQISHSVTPNPPSALDQTLSQPLAGTTPSALILNFNTVSGQSNNITTGMSFRCRSEGYFRNARDISCSKFYLCVKVGPKQYNLFEFMCLPHSGIQWRYSQGRNACVHPQDVEEC